MAFTEDLDDFFDTGDFAVDCLINTATPRTIGVIFSTPTEAVSVYEQSVEASAPFLICKTSDVAGVFRNHTATIDGTVYEIARISDDGNGTSRIYLKT
ncbi:MAG TPA: head-tail joining protein [Pyrinomonadaceae bacterium]|jgi:hypothetical protein